jgi:hypothetical protein
VLFLSTLFLLLLTVVTSDELDVFELIMLFLTALFAVLLFEQALKNNKHIRINKTVVFLRIYMASDTYDILYIYFASSNRTPFTVQSAIWRFLIIPELPVA